MTTGDALEQVGARTPATIGQATAVEQARAVAEVQAAIVVAQQCPRSIPAAIAQMEESCRQKALADRAFFRYSRGTSVVTGAAISLARELARCFGNIQYGITELRRDDQARISEMQAWAWDVQNNTRSVNTFVVPHVRDTKKGRVDIHDVRDVYENNANMGARRVRECIFAVMPAWFVQRAQDICRETIASSGGDKPLSQRIADAVASFGRMGITEQQLADKQGRPVKDFTVEDLATLTVVYQALSRGEISRDEEFPQQRVTADEIAGPAAPKLTGKLRAHMFAVLGELGISERDQQLDRIADAIGRRPEHRDAITDDEARRVIASLKEKGTDA